VVTLNSAQLRFCAPGLLVTILRYLGLASFPSLTLFRPPAGDIELSEAAARAEADQQISDSGVSPAAIGRVGPVSIQPTGALTGHIIFTSAGHG